MLSFRLAMCHLEHQGPRWIYFLQTKEQRIQTQMSQKTLGQQQHYFVSLDFDSFGTFLPDNENAGGSPICIHKELLPEEAIVSHVISCQGRDHLVMTLERLFDLLTHFAH